MKGIDPSATHPANSLTESSATMLRESFRFASIKQMPCCHVNCIHFNVIKIHFILIFVHLLNLIHFEYSFYLNKKLNLIQLIS